MSRIIRSEIYYTLHNGLIWILSALLLIMKVVRIFWETPDITSLILVAMVLYTNDLVFKERRCKTLKNLDSAGLSRAQIFWGKFIVVMVVFLAWYAMDLITNMIAYEIQGGDMTVNPLPLFLSVLCYMEMCLIIYVICWAVSKDTFAVILSFLYAWFFASILRVFTNQIYHLLYIDLGWTLQYELGTMAKRFGSTLYVFDTNDLWKFLIASVITGIITGLELLRLCKK